MSVSMDRQKVYSVNLTLKALSKIVADDIRFFYYYIFREDLTCHVNRLLGRWFTWNVNSNFLRNIQYKTQIKISSAAVVNSTLRVKTFALRTWNTHQKATSGALQAKRGLRRYCKHHNLNPDFSTRRPTRACSRVCSMLQYVFLCN